MTELKIARGRADIAYVVVHDRGDYFEIDDVCTNAPETPNTIRRVVDQTYYMQTGQHVFGSFIVDLFEGFRTWLHIFVGPFDSDVDLVLTRPDGSQVRPEDLGVSFNKTPTFVEVFIEGAAAGEWSYEIIANELDPGGESIRITVDEEAHVIADIPPYDIDIKPSEPDNVISLSARGKVAAAVLSAEEFNAPEQVDRGSLTFGRTGDEKSLLYRKDNRPNCYVQDVNDDKMDDLVCYFLVKYAAFQMGDTEGVLKGMTTAGAPFEGRDMVQIVP